MSAAASRAMTATLRRASRPLPFALSLLLIVLGAGILRLPGLSWERALGPAAKGFTFHIDEWTFVNKIRGFERRSPTWSGYVRGWTTQGWLLEQAGYRLLKLKDVDIIALLRRMSFVYGLLTIILVGVTGLKLFGSQELGLWAAAFTALSGLHVVNSHFGMADSSATFYDLLAILLAGVFDRSHKDWAFACLGVVVGASLAIKFQISPLPLLMLVCLRDRRRWLRSAQAALYVVAGFQIFSFFNYTPWEMKSFIHMLHANLEQPSEAPRDLLFVPRALVLGIGFGASLLVALGLFSVANRIRGLPRAETGKRLVHSPWLYPGVAGLTQYLLVSEMDMRAMRQTLVLIPIAALIAGRGIVWLRARWARSAASSWVVSAFLVAVILYQVYSVSTIERLYAQDPRFAAAQWLATHVRPDESVTAYRKEYSRFPSPCRFVDYPSDYVFGTALEYDRYLKASDPSQVTHTEGEERWRFWNQLFRGELSYDLVRRFTLPVVTPELLVIEKLGWTDMGLFLPREAVIFKKRSQLDAVPVSAEGI